MADEDDDAPRAPLPTPPPETPGPSVPAPLYPESETERREWADSLVPDEDEVGGGDPEETLLEQEESAAAAEARSIGGVWTRDSDDPALEPLYEAGEGEEEGFEAAERDLIDNATHYAEGGGNPLRDAFSPEAESDRSDAAYGGTDALGSTEVTHDPDSDEDDDPGDGTDVSFDRES
jgi:hypothetical protein